MGLLYKYQWQTKTLVAKHQWGKLVDLKIPLFYWWRNQNVKWLKPNFQKISGLPAAKWQENEELLENYPLLFLVPKIVGACAT